MAQPIHARNSWRPPVTTEVVKLVADYVAKHRKPRGAVGLLDNYGLANDTIMKAVLDRSPREAAGAVQDWASDIPLMDVARIAEQARDELERRGYDDHGNLRLASMSVLRAGLVRLARENPELREHVRALLAATKTM